MIIGKIINFVLSPNDTHEETKWEISTQPDFSAGNVLVSEATTDPEKLIVNVFQIDPALGVKYYGRARLRTAKCGWGEWENLDIIEVSSMEELNEIYILPSRVSIPRVFTKMYDPNATGLSLIDKELDSEDHPIIDFAICCDGYESITNAPHIATSWFIEDINQRVIWKSELDKINLNSIKVTNVVLDHNKIYRARAVFHSSTNDVSDGGCFTFRTCKELNIALRTYLETNLLDRTGVWTDAINLSLPFDTGVTKFMFVIEKYNSYGSEIIIRSTVTTQDPVWRIPQNTLEPNSTYVIKFRSVQEVSDPLNPGTLIEDSDDNWEVLFFTTF